MRGKILIVEDYADWRQLLTGLLQREGYQVEEMATLQEARRYIDQTKDLDLAILDIRLVETDETNEEGMRLLGEIHERGGFTRVIMITGHGTMETQRKAFREYHAFDFSAKSNLIRKSSDRRSARPWSRPSANGVLGRTRTTSVATATRCGNRSGTPNE